MLVWCLLTGSNGCYNNYRREFSFSHCTFWLYENSLNNSENEQNSIKCHNMQLIKNYDIVYPVVNMRVLKLVEKRSNTFTCSFTAHAPGGEELEILVTRTRILDLVLCVDRWLVSVGLESQISQWEVRNLCGRLYIACIVIMQWKATGTSFNIVTKEKCHINTKIYGKRERSAETNEGGTYILSQFRRWLIRLINEIFWSFIT